MSAVALETMNQGHTLHSQTCEGLSRASVPTGKAMPLITGVEGEGGEREGEGPGVEGRGQVRGGAWEGQGGALWGGKGVRSQEAVRATAQPWDRLGDFHTQTAVQRGVSHHAPNLPLTVPKKSNSQRPESGVAPTDAAF